MSGKWFTFNCVVGVWLRSNSALNWMVEMNGRWRRGANFGRRQQQKTSTTRFNAKVGEAEQPTTVYFYFSLCSTLVDCLSPHLLHRQPVGKSRKYRKCRWWDRVMQDVGERYCIAKCGTDAVDVEIRPKIGRVRNLTSKVWLLVVTKFDTNLAKWGEKRREGTTKQMRAQWPHANDAEISMRRYLMGNIHNLTDTMLNGASLASPHPANFHRDKGNRNNNSTEQVLNWLMTTTTFETS